MHSSSPAANPSSDKATRVPFRIKAIYAAALLLPAVFIFLAVTVPGWRRKENNACQLPDGRFVEIAAVTHGNTHTFPKSPRWSQLARFAPSSFRRLTGPAFGGVTFGFGNDGLALWLMCYDPAKDGYTYNFFSKGAIVDEHGCVFTSSGKGATGDNYFACEILNFPAYPRRQSQFNCDLLDGAGRTIATLPIEVVQTNEFPEWKAFPLPIHLTNGRFKVSLTSFNNSDLPECEIWENGKRSEDWQFEERHFLDATGNKGESLCLKEAAWKWTAKLFRKASGQFGSNEMITVQLENPPASGTLIQIKTNIAPNQLRLEPLYFAGPGLHTFSNEVASTSTPWSRGMSPTMSSTSSGASRIVNRGYKGYFVAMKQQDYPADKKVVVRLRSGTNLLAVADSPGKVDQIYFYDLEYTGNLPSPVELDFIVKEGMRFEAYVSPSDVKR